MRKCYSITNAVTEPWATQVYSESAGPQGSKTK